MKKLLLQMGFSEKEAEVYLVLLRNGKSTADDIRRITAIERTNIYKILQRLEERNYLTSMLEERKKVFEARHPKFLLQQLKQQQEELQSELPKLEKILPSTATGIHVFRGESGLKQLGNEVLTSTKNYDVLGDQGLLQKVLPYYSRQFLKKVEKLKIKERVIACESSKVLKSKNSEIRILHGTIMPATTVILEKSIILVDWSEPCAIKIDNNNLARAYHGSFQQLWKVSKRI